MPSLVVVILTVAIGNVSPAHGFVMAVFKDDESCNQAKNEAKLDHDREVRSFRMDDKPHTYKCFPYLVIGGPEIPFAGYHR